MFSIVIPLYNKAQYVIRALESIRSQSYKEFEVIIIDDGSIDDSYNACVNWISSLSDIEICKYHILKKSNGGVSSARNAGIRHALQPYVAFLDADDYWEEHHLNNLLNLIKNYARDVDIFSNAISQLMDGNIILPKLGKYSGYRGVCSFLKTTSISGGFINSSSVCVKRKVFELLEFPEDMSNFEDIITWAKISGVKGFAFNSERTAVYCIDSAESSVVIDMANYLRFERKLKQIGYNPINVYIYLFKFYLLSFMFAKISSQNCLHVQWRYVFGKSLVAILPFIIAVLFPVHLVLRLRNIRKTL
jgi:glycosyltransferase involved in cell wall biosynthesis